MKLSFRRNYALIALALFVIEVLIALYVRDSFIRPKVGDYLVVIFLYCFLMAFVEMKVWKAALIVWLFAIAVECLQYVKIVEVLGWQDSELARVLIGTHFNFEDIVAYSLGILTVLGLEWLVNRQKTS
ncbi:MAG: DUF2809 domain-containing protein [Bacteroidota bacterium]